MDHSTVSLKPTKICSFQPRQYLNITVRWYLLPVNQKLNTDWNALTARTSWGAVTRYGKPVWMLLPWRMVSSRPRRRWLCASLLTIAGFGEVLYRATEARLSYGSFSMFINGKVDLLIKAPIFIRSQMVVQPMRSNPTPLIPWRSRRMTGKSQNGQ